MYVICFLFQSHLFPDDLGVKYRVINYFKFNNRINRKRDKLREA